MHLAFENITADRITFYNIDATVLRLDRIHPVISGNKWFKLQHYLEQAKAQNKKRIVTFGGAWSNHIVATAAASQLNGFFSAGIIRGEEPTVLSTTLLAAKKYGMQLYFINRHDYREDHVPDEFVSEENYLIPQGGFGKMGALGAAGILALYHESFTHCCCAVGTGTMMAGLIRGAPGQNIVGISALKNNLDLETEIASLVNDDSAKWDVRHEYHFGGFAKYQPALIEFMNEFYRKTHIPSDFVYTGKLFFAIDDLVKKNFFPAESKLLIIHSGGLQGNDSLGKGKLIY